MNNNEPVNQIPQELINKIAENTNESVETVTKIIQEYYSAYNELVSKTVGLL